MALPPVILLHGCGGSPEQAFARTGWLDAFANTGREVLAVRLPGHGRDGASHYPAAYADLTATLIAELPFSFDVVGFSLGAKLAIDIAVRFPGRIRRMVLGGIGDNAFAPEAIGEAAARALEHGPDADTPAPVRAFLATWEPTRNDPLAIAAVLRRAPNPVFVEADIAALDVPVMVVNGSDDFVAARGTRLFDALGIEQQQLLGVGHFDLTGQEQFRDRAVAFLGEESAKGDQAR